MGRLERRSLEPKSSAIPTSLHPDIHFSAMIPRRAVKIKFFLSVVIYVVKGDFMPLSAIVESPANAGVARLCGVSFCHAPDTATALPNHPRYQLRYTRIFNSKVLLSVVIHVVKADFSPGSAFWSNPANARVPRLSELRLLLSWIGGAALPNHPYPRDAQPLLYSFSTSCQTPILHLPGKRTRILRM